MKNVSAETLQFAKEEIDSALSALVPRASDAEIAALFFERLKEARESYGDFLTLE